MIIFDERDVRSLYPMKESIESMRAALRSFSAGAVIQPQRLMLRTPEGDAYAVMPSYVGPSADAPDAGFGIKVIAVKPGNPARGLPVNAGLVMVFDAGTGRPAALLDGAAVTAIRTAAASAAATDLLARPDAGVLAILGAGVQARSHLAAMAEVRTLREARVWSRTPARAAAFAAAAGELPFPVTAAASPAAAADGADLVCTVTGSVTPLLDAPHIAPGAHVNAVGSSFPDKRELTADLVARCAVFVDGRRAALAEAGEIVIPVAAGRFGPEVIRAEIGELLLGRAAGRRDPGEITLFKSLGIAVEDAVAGLHIARRARELGRGRDVPFG
ncbi:ornithine cyclodeaminase family protein [Actinomadura sp. NAK00032]|uniref:ornithine cyclodeaminase family protein n=1 Tax=Actinomadura sp. NAK00032 TaxID=2742128 RepID=UPI001590289E|nr:ornithine cyclodeaminase family protein [Actinomadura sp. NAK00032]QKW35607.1 ornithine cyclodeaminase family protein [Actinomadura sp. NAK00032]